MDKEEKLKKVMQESRQIFLNEEKKKLNEILLVFLRYKLYNMEEDARELERFFHSLQGTSSTLSFNELASIGAKYESYLNDLNKIEGISERVFINLLEGLSQVYENLNSLFNENNIEKINEVKQDLNNKKANKGNIFANELSDNDSRKSCGEQVQCDLLDAEIVSKKRILLIDDVSAIVHLMQKNLEALGYEIITANDGKSGIEKCKLFKPDLMIVDLILPKVNGFEVCRQVKGSSETKGTKVIVVSSRNTKEDVLRCFEAGADDYMIKPFSMVELEQRISKLI